jgi:hypothetical protein
MPYYALLVLVHVVLMSGTILYAVAEKPLDCTFYNIENNYLKFEDVVLDVDIETTIPPSSNSGLQKINVSYVDIVDNPYVSVSESRYFGLVFLNFKQINEVVEPSRRSEFYYNVKLNLHCNNSAIVEMYSSIRLIDTNNHEPFFDKPRYTYNLISAYVEDFQRQLILYPIVATDYDITNIEVDFTIQENPYFDILYGGVVPGSLNKKHYPKLVPKTHGTLLTERIELEIVVTDVGTPPRQNFTKLVINPPSPPAPIFDKTFYVGHYYKNDTFVINESPELAEGTTYYQTRVTINNKQRYQNNFISRVENGKIVIEIYHRLDSSFFFQNNYIAYELEATYVDVVTNRATASRATLIVELHHDL